MGKFKPISKKLTQRFPYDNAIILARNHTTCDYNCWALGSVVFFLLFRIINMELVGGGGGGENRRLHWSKVKNYTTVGNTNFLIVIRVCVWGGGGGGGGGGGSY